MDKRILAVMAAVLMSGLAACGSARRGEPIVGPTVIQDARAINGQRAFMAHCHQCHPKGESGLGPAINNKPLPGFLIRMQIRAGFGAMPSFSESEISDADAADIVRYLKAIK